MQRLGGDQENQITGVVQSPERTIRLQLTCDWARTGDYRHPLSDMTEYVQSVTLDRSLTGSAPEEIMLIEGSAAAQLTVKLSGTYDGQTLDKIFSPYNSKGYFYNQDLPGVTLKYYLYLDTPIGLASYPQFIGYVRSIKPVRGEGSITIEALDYTEDLRRPITAPPWAIDLGNANRGVVGAQLINSSWVIDNALRQCDVSPTPWRPPTFNDLNRRVTDADGQQVNTFPDGFQAGGHQFWASLSGALIPTVGYTTRQYLNDYADLDGVVQSYYEQNAPEPTVGLTPSDAPKALVPINKGSSNFNHVSYWVKYREGVVPRFSSFLTATFILDNDRQGDYWNQPGESRVCWVELTDHIQVDLWVGGGKVWTTWRVTNTTNPDDYDNASVWSSSRYDLTSFVASYDDPQWVRVTGLWSPNDTSNGMKCNILYSSNSYTFGYYGWETTGAPYPPANESSDVQDAVRRGIVTIDDKASVSDVSFLQSNYNVVDSVEAKDWSTEFAKRAAYLDPGLQDFSYMPMYKAEDAWDLITEVAAAEWGSVFWDERGRFRFWNYDTIKAKQSDPVRTYSTDELESLEFEVSYDSVRNIYSTETGRGTSAYGTIYESSNVDEFVVPPQTELHFYLAVDEMLSPNPYPPTVYESDSASSNTKPDWNDDVIHGVVYQYLQSDGQWNETADTGLADNATIRAFFTVDGNLGISIRNYYNNYIRLARGVIGADENAQPACRIGGTLKDEYDKIVTTVTDQPSIDKFGGRNYKQTGDWYQDSSGLEDLMRKQIPRTVRPIPTTNQITVPGDPRIQLADCIDIRDPDGFGGTLKMQIYGITRTYSPDEGLSDAYTVEVIRLSAIGIWDDPEYGLWDDSFIWSA